MAAGGIRSPGVRANSAQPRPAGRGIVGAAALQPPGPDLRPAPGRPRTPAAAPRSIASRPFSGKTGRPVAAAIARPEGRPVAGQAPGLGDPGGVGQLLGRACRRAPAAAPRLGPIADRVNTAAPRSSGPPRRPTSAAAAAGRGRRPPAGTSAAKRSSGSAGAPAATRRASAARSAPSGSTAASTPGLRHQRQRADRVGRRQQALQLHPDPLGREPRQPRHRRADRRQRRRVGRAPAVAGLEAEEAQRPQVVLGQPRRRVADEAHPPGRQVLPPAEIIPERAVGSHRHGVDGEVAPRRVLPPVGGPVDLGMAAIGGDVAAQAGHLDRLRGPARRSPCHAPGRSRTPSARRRAAARRCPPAAAAPRRPHPAPACPPARPAPPPPTARAPGSAASTAAGAPSQQDGRRRAPLGRRVGSGRGPGWRGSRLTAPARGAPGSRGHPGRVAPALDLMRPHRDREAEPDREEEHQQHPDHRRPG